MESIESRWTDLTLLRLGSAANSCNRPCKRAKEDRAGDNGLFGEVSKEHRAEMSGKKPKSRLINDVFFVRVGSSLCWMILTCCGLLIFQPRLQRCESNCTVEQQQF
jgi:hypothetical protein